jgi:hypothetical protein
VASSLRLEGLEWMMALKNAWYRQPEVGVVISRETYCGQILASIVALNAFAVFTVHGDIRQKVSLVDA